MANYNQISYGSHGSDVTELQKLLNQNGYNLDTDGIFGSNTQNAVKEYQQKNGLTVDGIVGKNTWGALTNASTATPNTPAQTETKAPTFEYGAYTPSDTVSQAEALLQQQMAQQPGAYQSAWQTQLNDTLQKILNREQFSYDLNGDALYQQYKDQYTTQGKMAMMDTMGQAAAMTGGYGNSYAQSVGQQAYQGYLQQINDKIPELYNLALSKYQMEGDALYNQAALMAQQEDQDYGRYRDQVSDYYTELDRLYNQYNTERDYDYGKWADGRDFGYGQYIDDRNMAYQTERDKVADQQWQAQFDEAKRQYDQQYALSASKGSGSGGSGGSGGGGGGSVNNGNLSTSEIKKLQTALGVTADGKWGPASQAAAQKKLGASSADAAWANYQKNLNGRIEGNDVGVTSFTGSTYSEAAAYLKANGKSASGLMTSSEWTRHKNKNNSAGGEHEVSSYKEYLTAYIYGVMN